MLKLYIIHIGALFENKTNNNMNKLYNFLLISVAFSLFSCGNSAEEISPDEKLLGKWSLILLKSEGVYTEPTFDINYTFIGEGINMDMVYEFIFTNNELKVTGTSGYRLTFNMDGTEFVQEMSNYAAIVSGKWQRDADKLIITDNSGIGQQYNIVELTDTSLKLSGTRTTTSTTFGSTGTMEETTTINFVRM